MIERDYMKAWVSPEGAEYRRAVYERQRAGGTRPLVDNPTVEEIRDALLVYQPQDVLEIGCGWGRLTEALEKWFGDIYGCDVSWEMLQKATPNIRPRLYVEDIVNPLPKAMDDDPYDVLFCRGVMMSIPPDKLGAAMRNMEAMARKKVLVWEWTDICNLMRSTYASEKFEYHSIPVRDE